MWKTIQGFDKYEVSDVGEIRNKKSGRILKQKKDRKGYYTISLYDVNLGKKYPTIHRLIALHFIDNPNNYTDIDHINGIRTDNNIENLRWVSRQQNMWNKVVHKGYKLNPSGRYCASIRINGRIKGIGTYDTEEEAHQAYINKAIELRGGFVRQ